jgi:hypothetical protein
VESNIDINNVICLSDLTRTLFTISKLNLQLKILQENLNLYDDGVLYPTMALNQFMWVYFGPDYTRALLHYNVLRYYGVQDLHRFLGRGSYLTVPAYYGVLYYRSFSNIGPIHYGGPGYGYLAPYYAEIVYY